MKQYIKVLIICAALVTLAPFIPMGTAADAPNRADTLWSVGYQTAPTDFNPYAVNPAWGVAYMYEPLFGRNYGTGYNGSLIPILGSSMSWSTDGKNLTILLNPDAKWSDGSAVTADDVVYSITLAATKATANFASGDNAIYTRVASVTAVNSTQVNLGMQAAYPFSGLVDLWLTTNLNIVPKAVWEQIVAGITTNGTDFVNFHNNWLDSSFPSGWKVASGPYVPYDIATDLSEEIYIRRDSYWGSGKINLDLPATGGLITQAPLYVGLKHYAQNVDQATAFATGVVDWFAGYYDSIWNIFASYPHVQTWFGHNAPYFVAAASPVTLEFNLDVYPLNQLWFRQALGLMANYKNASTVYASGYSAHIPLGYVTPTVAPLAPIYNDSIYDLPMPGVSAAHQYITMRTPDTGNVSAGLTILSEHASYNAGTNRWTVTDGSNPAGTSPYVLGVSDLYYPNGTKLSAILSGDVVATPLNILCQPWGDVKGQFDAAQLIWAANGIPVTVRTESFDAGIFQADILAGNISMALGGLAYAPLLNSPLLFFASFIGEHTGWGANTTRWSGAAADKFVADFEKLEVQAQGSAAYLAYASDMQYQLATDLPSFPFVANGYWYAYNDKYFTGWPNTGNEYQQICASFETRNEALRCRIVMDLYPRNAHTAPSGTVAAFPVFFILLAAAAPVVVVLARFRKNPVSE
jgi:ABC-type transport system substrate-binding protein